MSESSDILPERDVSRNLSNLKPALAFLAPYRWHIVGASLALVLTASVTLSIGQGIRLVIDAGFAGGSASDVASSVGSSSLLTESLMVFAALVVLLTAGTYARYYLVSWIGERVSADIRQAVFDRLIRLHPGFFEANLPTEIQSRLTTDTTLLQTVIGSSVSVALRNLLMFVGGVSLLLVSNLKLSLVVLASAPVVVAPIVLFGRRVRRLSRSSQDTIARVGSYVGEAFRHIKVVQAFNHGPRDKAAFDAHVETAFDVAVLRIRQRAWLVALVMLLVLSAIATMVWMGGQDVLAGRTSPGELAAFIFYAFIVAGAVGSLSEVLSDLQRAAGATERLVELLEAGSDLAEPERPTPLPSGDTVDLAFDAVTFAYATRPAARVLDGVSFRIEHGEMAALVGPSGAGKTTIFELALRFYDPDAGAVRLGGIDIRQLSLADLRGAIGLVPQDAALFAGTVNANVRYGQPDATPDEVEQALRLANAFDFVAALPEGLETAIGEDGVGLSGGQRQRLAIARALLSRPRLLLLDEATSALDAQSEEAIRQALAGLRGRCTVLIIAHRLSTVVAADRTLVLDGGRVVAAGRHAELVETSALYREFASIQLQQAGTLASNEVVGGVAGR